MPGVAEFTQAVEGLPSFMVQGDRGTLVSNGETIELLETDPDDTSLPIEDSHQCRGKTFRG